VAKSRLETCSGATRTTLGRQVLKADFLSTMGRNSLSDNLEACDAILDVIALALLPEPVGCYGDALTGVMDSFNTGDGIPHGASHHMRKFRRVDVKAGRYSFIISDVPASKPILRRRNISFDQSAKRSTIAGLCCTRSLISF
jgi:hypothetical protein